MSSICQHCTIKINANQHKIECSSCNKKFHGSCMNLTNGDISYLLEKNEAWSCPGCFGDFKSRRSLSVSDVPLLQSRITQDASAADSQLTTRHFDMIMAEFNRAGAAHEALSSKLNALIDTQSKLSEAIETCNQRLLKHDELLKDHAASIADSDQKMVIVRDSLVALEQKVETLSASVQNTSINCAGSSTFADTDSLLREIGDREKRSCNLMVFGVPESSSADLQRRIADDTSHIEVMMAKLGVDIIARKVLRVGKLGVKPRPLKLILSSREDVFRCLKNKKKLQNSDLRINSDLTELQRTHLRGLRQQLRDRIDGGEKDVTIRYVDGVPKIIKTSSSAAKK